MIEISSLSNVWARPSMTEDPGRESAYPIGKYPAVNQNALLLSRALAIQAYAMLEFSLSILFCHWLGTTSDVGSLVFFRITSSHTRNSILKDLKQKRLQDQHNLFWNSLLKFIRALDDRRNEIVHCVIMNNIDLSSPHENASKLTLSSLRDLLSHNQNRASIDEHDLNDFIKRCEFASRLVNLFHTLQGEHRTQMPRELIDLFDRRLVYPPPDDHPLSPNRKPSETPATGTQ
jgi:hypothetical protein